MSTQAWQRFYEEAVLETDRSKLPTLIERAELAITERLTELSGSSDHGEERRFIENARRGLATLRWEARTEAGQAAAN